MKTAIFRKFIQLLLLALLLNTAILYIVTGSVILNNSRKDMVFILDTIDSAFHYDGDLEAQAKRISKSADLNDSRLTIIDPDGVVKVDTGVKDASELENHMQRIPGSAKNWRGRRQTPFQDSGKRNAVCGGKVILL